MKTLVSTAMALALIAAASPALAQYSSPAGGGQQAPKSDPQSQAEARKVEYQGVLELLHNAYEGTRP